MSKRDSIPASGTWTRFQEKAEIECLYFGRDSQDLHGHTVIEDEEISYNRPVDGLRVLKIQNKLFITDTKKENDKIHEVKYDEYEN